MSPAAAGSTFPFRLFVGFRLVVPSAAAGPAAAVDPNAPGPAGVVDPTPAGRPAAGPAADPFHLLEGI